MTGSIIAVWGLCMCDCVSETEREGEIDRDRSIAQHIHVRLLPHAAAMLLMLLGQATHALISSESYDCFSLQAQCLVPG